MNRFFTVILFFYFVVNTYAMDRQIFEKMQRNFVYDLFSEGRYFEAIGEAGKLGLRKDDWRLDYFVNSSYYLGEQYRTVIHHYELRQNKRALTFPGALLLSKSYYKIGKFENSWKSLKGFDYIKLSDDLKFELFKARTETFIIASKRNLLENEVKIAEPFLRNNPNFFKLRAELQKFNNMRDKSPLFAGGLSVLVPGLGQMYSGRIWDGVISFVAVVSTFAGAMHYRSEGKSGEFRSLIFLSGLFYSGNIYSAANSAVSSNSERNKLFLKKMNSSYSPYRPDDYFNKLGNFN